MTTTTELTDPPARHDRLVDAVGLAYFPLALAARLPYAMVVVGVLTLVVASRGSLSLGGLNSAVVGIGTALCGPLIGAAVDRYGQRSVMVVAGIVHSLTLAAMCWVVFSSLPDLAVLVVAFAVGASAPQVGPLSRTRLVEVIGRLITPARRSRVFHSTMAYESGADEVVFVFGPVIVGLLATGLAPVAPVIAAAVLTAVFVVAFALHPSGRLATGSVSVSGRSATGVEQAPLRELVRPGLVVVVLGVLGIGLLFGSVLTALTAYTDDHGHSGSAGLLYGALGVGSAVMAILVGRFPSRFTLRARLVVFAAVLVTGVLLLGLATSLPMIIVAMVIAGIGIGPLLVTGFSLGSMRSPYGRAATVMTMLGSAIMVGQAIASAVTGWIGEVVGVGAALWTPTVAAAVVVVAAAINWRLDAVPASPSAAGSPRSPG